jgi:hypothetical protein
MRYFLVCVFMLSINWLVAQEEKEDLTKPGFHAAIDIGYSAGESGVFPSYQAISGVHYKKWIVGLGAGFDAYRYKSFPVFISAKNTFGKKQGWFGYVNGGYNIPAKTNKGEAGDNFKTTDRFVGGFYMDAGVGIRFKLGQNNNLLFSSGYSYKRIKSIIGYTYPCLTTPCNEEVYHYQYGLGRIVTRVGWEFNAQTKK